jgi:hypothetical protein
MSLFSLFKRDSLKGKLPEAKPLEGMSFAELEVLRIAADRKIAAFQGQPESLSTAEEERRRIVARQRIVIAESTSQPSLCRAN